MQCHICTVCETLTYVALCTLPITSIWSVKADCTRLQPYSLSTKLCTSVLDPSAIVCSCCPKHALETFLSCLPDSKKRWVVDSLRGRLQASETSAVHDYKTWNKVLISIKYVAEAYVRHAQRSGLDSLHRHVYLQSAAMYQARYFELVHIEVAARSKSPIFKLEEWAKALVFCNLAEAIDSQPLTVFYDQQSNVA